MNDETIISELKQAFMKGKELQERAKAMKKTDPKAARKMEKEGFELQKMAFMGRIAFESGAK